MAIDLRAVVSCTLGPVISGSISDSFIEGSGLITTTGQCEIKGIITPNIGQIVAFGYIKNGVARNIPKSLRVLSYFANPFTGITSVSLGCKLTYLADLQEPINWSAFDDPQNSERTEAEQQDVIIPINAKSIAEKCISELGLSSDPVPLTNVFSTESFEFSSGYVPILSDLLVSESYYGYLDQREHLNIKRIDFEPGSVPILSRSNILEVGPLNSGELPGEAVTVSYSNLTYSRDTVESTTDTEDGGEGSAGEDANPYNWDYEQTISEGLKIEISLEPFVNGLGEEETPVVEFTNRTVTTTTTKYDKWDRVTERISIEVRNNAAVVPDFVAVVGNSGGPIIGPSFASLEGNRRNEKVTITTFEYLRPYKASKERPEDYDSILTETTIVKEPYINLLAPLISSFAQGTNPSRIDLFYSSSIVVTERTIVDYTTSGFFTVPLIPAGRGFRGVVNDKKLITKAKTTTYQARARLSAWQKSVVKNAKDIQSVKTAVSLWGDSLEQTDLNIRTITGRSAYAQTRPSGDGKTASSDSNSSSTNTDSTSDVRSASNSRLVLVSGSAQAQKIIEFTMPYASDDFYVRSSESTYTKDRTDAPIKALRFGNVQNRILAGTRNGMNLQVPPEVVPNYPFAPIAIRINGVSAMYRTNGMSWTFDSSGLICSIDAVYWGVIGKSS